MEWEIRNFINTKNASDCFFFDHSKPQLADAYWQSYENFLSIALDNVWELPSCEHPFANFILSTSSPEQFQNQSYEVQVEINHEPESIRMSLPTERALHILEAYCNYSLGKTRDVEEVPRFVLVAMFRVELCWTILSTFKMGHFFIETFKNDEHIDPITMRRYINFSMKLKRAAEDQSFHSKRQKNTGTSGDQKILSSPVETPILENLQFYVDAREKSAATKFLNHASGFTYHKADIGVHTMAMFSTEQTAAVFENRGVAVPKILQVPLVDKIVYHLRENIVEWKLRLTTNWLAVEYKRVTGLAAEFTILTLEEHLFIVTRPSQMTAFQIILDYAKIEFDKTALTLPETALHLRNLTFEYLQQSQCNLMDLSLYGWLRSLAYMIGGRKLARRVILPTSRRFPAYHSFAGFLNHWGDCTKDEDFLELIEILTVFLDMNTEHMITRQGLEYLRTAFQLTSPNTDDNDDLLRVISRLFKDRFANEFSLRKLGFFTSTSNIMDWADIYKSVVYSLPLPSGLVKNILREIFCASEKKPLPQIKHIRPVSKRAKSHDFLIFMQSTNSEKCYQNTKKDLSDLNVHTIADRESEEYETFFNSSQITNGFVFNDTRGFYDNRKELKEYHNTAQALESVISRITRNEKRRVRSAFCTPKFSAEYCERLTQSFNFGMLIDPDKNSRIPILLNEDRVVYFEQAFITFDFAKKTTLDTNLLNIVSRGFCNS